MQSLAHTMPESDEEAQRQLEEVFGIRACLWLWVVRAVLASDDVITIAPTGGVFDLLDPINLY